MTAGPNVFKMAGLAIGATVSNSVKTTRANEFFKWGLKLPVGSALREEKLEMAEKLFRDAADGEMEKGNVRKAVNALEGLAEMYGSRAEALKGIGEFERAASEFKKQGTVYGEIVLALNRNGDGEKVAEISEKLITAHKNAIGAMEKQSELHEEDENPEALKDTYKKMIPIYKDIASTFQGLGDYGAVVDACESQLQVFEKLVNVSKKDSDTLEYMTGMQLDFYTSMANAYEQLAEEFKGNNLDKMTDACTNAADAHEARVSLLRKTGGNRLAEEMERAIRPLELVVEKWKLAKESVELAPNLVVDARKHIIRALDRIADVREMQAKEFHKMSDVAGEASTYGLMAKTLCEMAEGYQKLKEHKKAGDTYSKAIKALEKKSSVHRKQDSYGGAAETCGEKAGIYKRMAILFEIDLKNQDAADKAQRKRISELGKKGEALGRAEDYAGAAEAYGEQAADIDSFAFNFSTREDTGGYIGSLGKESEALVNKAEMLGKAGAEGGSKKAYLEAVEVLKRRADVLRENEDYKGEAGTYRKISEVLTKAGENEGAAEALRLSEDADRAAGN